MANRAVKYQLFPTEEQAQLISKTVGCARFVYNNLLDDYNGQLQQGIAKPKLKLVTFLKKDNTFLNEVDSLALMNGRTHLETALKNFFDSKSGKRKGREVGFPTKKKKRKAKLSYTTNNQHGTVRIEGNAIKLPKVGFVKFKCHRTFDGDIKSVTITQTRDGVYYASVLFEIEGETKAKPIKPYNELRVVGIDMSMKEFAVDSEGENASPECGTKNSDLKLSDRAWVCPVCGCILDRDYNAALNLRDYFMKVIPEEKYKNTVGTAEIHASGEKTATLREIFSQVGSLSEEKKPLNL